MQVFGQIFVKRVQRHEDAQVNLAILANFCDFGVQRPAVLLIFAGFYRIRANRPALLPSRPEFDNEREMK